MDRHPFRPAHIHFIVSLLAQSFKPRRDRVNVLSQALAEGYKPITTQIFDRQSEYLDNDSVFAVKESLVVDFVPIEERDHKASVELEYDVLLAPVGSSV